MRCGPVAYTQLWRTRRAGLRSSLWLRSSKGYRHGPAASSCCNAHCFVRRPSDRCPIAARRLRAGTWWSIHVHHGRKSAARKLHTDCRDHRYRHRYRDGCRQLCRWRDGVAIRSSGTRLDVRGLVAVAVCGVVRDAGGAVDVYRHVHQEPSSTRHVSPCRDHGWIRYRNHNRCRQLRGRRSGVADSGPGTRLDVLGLVALPVRGILHDAGGTVDVYRHIHREPTTSHDVSPQRLDCRNR